MPHKPPSNQQPPFNEMVEEYLLEMEYSQDFTHAHYVLTRKFGYDTAQRVTQYCLNTGITTCIRGKIIITKKEPANG